MRVSVVLHIQLCNADCSALSWHSAAVLLQTRLLEELQRVITQILISWLNMQRKTTLSTRRWTCAPAQLSTGAAPRPFRYSD